MFKNIFNAPDSLRNAFLGQDELRAKSQQGLQAVKSGVESLRTVLAKHPVESNSTSTSTSTSTSSGDGQDHTQSRSGPASNPSTAFFSSSSTSTFIPGTGVGRGGEGGGSTGRPVMTSRDRSGSWSFLPPSLISGRHFQNNSSSSSLSSIPGQQRPGSIKEVAGSFTDSVTESIKNLGTGLKLGQIAEGLGLNGSGPGPMPSLSRRGTGDLQQLQQGPYLNSTGGQASRSRVWTWNGQNMDNDNSEGAGSDADSVLRRSDGGGGLKAGAKTKEAAKETEALLAKVREQQDQAMERAKRMPEVEKMAQRYQDSWTEIHSHTTHNSEKADNADEILEKVLELCMRHVNASVQLAEGAKDLKHLDKSLDDMMAMSENIQKKLTGLESAIVKLEEEADALSLADWKKSKTTELDKYMEMKRNELWDKAELLSVRSEQFQKEEAKRKLRLYQNRFETDMAQFRKTQEEREQELWKIAEAQAEAEAAGHSNSRAGRTGLLSAIGGLSVLQSTAMDYSGARASMDTSGLGLPAEALAAHDDEELREKEDLNRFLGPATESDSKEDEADSDAEDHSSRRSSHDIKECCSRLSI
ncbi:hypothetical protein BC939DRAFT_438208 [Gamsiella multidivaricata]|uniref:uncharacterized protein n=1 Tax=Gamsiella multidivaricata TaxID=101098 RepID=UPI00221ED805|nr:uncharacterized protein BC939DRAFT_438208 [Gamsiella multidivaricata]KAI7831318.1 hypothetical protein BC939DRAFT_438208 [Gamsiella multidivaricata]